MLLGEENVAAEMKAVFPAMHSSPGPSNSEATVLSRADKLLSQLRSSSPQSSVQSCVRKRYKRRVIHKRSKDYQRNLVVIDYPGKHPPDVQVLHDYNKIYEGTISFNDASSEESIKDEIASLIQLKSSYAYDFASITPDDFVFVKCVNRRVRVPDGKAVYDSEGLRSLYRSGNIYIRLTKSILKHKV